MRSGISRRWRDIPGRRSPQRSRALACRVPACRTDAAHPQDARADARRIQRVLGHHRRDDVDPAVVLPAQEVDLIRVYRIPFSTNVERIALAAGHKGIAIDWVDVDPDDRSPVEAVSGQRLVPVLVADDGEVVVDSPVILEWL